MLLLILYVRLGRSRNSWNCIFKRLSLERKSYGLGRHAKSVGGCSCPHTSPQNPFCRGYLWIKDTPIFCTSNARIRKYDHGQVNELETEMMDARWTIFPLRHQFREPKEIPAYSKCFTIFLKNDSTLWEPNWSSIFLFKTR